MPSNYGGSICVMKSSRKSWPRRSRRRLPVRSPAVMRGSCERSRNWTARIIPADASDPSMRKVVNLVRDEIKLEDQEAKAKIIDVPGENHKNVRLGIIDLPSFYADFESERRKDGQQKSTTADVKKLLAKLK